jgi:large subunit ribosomal protein L19e
MADLRNQRRMASTILKCGEYRVWMDSDRIDEIAKAVTRNDMKALIKGGAITSRQIQGISSGRDKYQQKQKDKGRRKGHGSRKGAKYARLPRKDRWIRTIRPIRSYLKQLRDGKAITAHIDRKYYQKAKGGEFRSRQHLKSHLISDGIIKEEKP